MFKKKKSQKDENTKEKTTVSEDGKVQTTVKEKRTKMVNDLGRVYTWRDQVCPSAIEFRTKSMMLGDAYIKPYSIYNYPPNVSAGWLRDLAQTENTICVFHCEEGNKYELKKMIDFALREEQVRIATNAEKSQLSDIQDSQDKMQKTLELSQRIMGENAAVTGITPYIFAYADNEEELAKVCNDVEGKLNGNGFVPRNIPYKTQEAFNAMLPVCDNQYKAFTELTMTSDVVHAGLGMFPSLGVNDPTGMYIGFDTSRCPVFMDIWSKSYGKTNSNLAIIGKSGSGKSATAKTMVVSELSRGAKVILLDPEEEYLSIADYFNGNVINAAGEGNVINPLQLRDFPDKFDEMSEEEIKRAIEENSIKGPLSTHITFLRGWFKLYQPDMRMNHLAVIEDALYETYKRKGITEFSDPRKMKNDQFPIMSDLVAVLKEYAEANKDNNKRLYNEAILYLNSAVNGADRFQFNGHTNVDLSNRFNVFNVHKLMDAPENVKNAQFSNITSFVWLTMTKNKEEKVILDVDEAHLFISEKSPETFEFLGNLCKRARKYKGSLWITTQNISDFLHPSIARFGEGIWANTSCKFIMKSDSTDIQKMSRLFDLTEEQEKMIKEAGIGDGLLSIGDMKVFTHIAIEPTVLQLCQAGGGK